MKRKFLIDVDTGVDDAQALMLALSRPDVHVVGITCVSGNVDVDQVCTNTFKVLATCGRLDVPVYRGADRPLVTTGFTSTHYHGEDGLGDSGRDVDISGAQLQQEHAVSAIVRLVNQYPGEITLVALAPLTNIALALRQDPDLGSKLASLTVMGGNTQGRGNSTLCGEFNFAVDPDAAHVVLEDIRTCINLVPWEVNLTASACQPWEWFDKWIETDSDKARFMKAIVQSALRNQRELRKMAFYRSCDLGAMVTAIDPDVINGSEDVFATVELTGTYTRGMMVVDWNGQLKKPSNVRLVTSMDTLKARLYFDRML